MSHKLVILIKSSVVVEPLSICLYQTMLVTILFYFIFEVFKYSISLLQIWPLIFHLKDQRRNIPFHQAVPLERHRLLYYKISKYFKNSICCQECRRLLVPVVILINIMSKDFVFGKRLMYELIGCLCLTKKN